MNPDNVLETNTVDTPPSSFRLEQHNSTPLMYNSSTLHGTKYPQVHNGVLPCSMTAIKYIDQSN